MGRGWSIGLAVVVGCADVAPPNSVLSSNGPTAVEAEEGPAAQGASEDLDLDDAVWAERSEATDRCSVVERNGATTRTRYREDGLVLDVEWLDTETGERFGRESRTYLAEDDWRTASVTREFPFGDEVQVTVQEWTWEGYTSTQMFDESTGSAQVQTYRPDGKLLVDAWMLDGVSQQESRYEYLDETDWRLTRESMWWMSDGVLVEGFATEQSWDGLTAAGQERCGWDRTEHFRDDGRSLSRVFTDLNGALIQEEITDYVTDSSWMVSSTTEIWWSVDEAFEFVTPVTWVACDD